jgi:ribosomal protein S18 acetylase RimI-like enzyme
MDRSKDPNSQFTVRLFREADRQELIDCMVELQEHERKLEPLRLPGTEMAPPYVEAMLDGGIADGAQIFVACSGDKVAGFVCVFPKSNLDEGLNQPAIVAYVGDIIVLPQFRRLGVARQLMDEAERVAKEHGAEKIMLHVLFDNAPARQFYLHSGYREYELTLIKDL